MTPASGVSRVHMRPRARFLAGSVVVMAAILGACEGTAPTSMAPTSIAPAPTAPPEPPPPAPTVFAPCPGVSVAALPPVASDEFSDHLATNVTVELSNVGVGTALDFLGPYTLSEYHNPYMAGRIGNWRVEIAGESVRHEVAIDWTQELEESDLQLGLVGGECVGNPVVVCSSDGCRLDQD